jgi:hypothetical protein
MLPVALLTIVSWPARWRLVKVNVFAIPLCVHSASRASWNRSGGHLCSASFLELGATGVASAQEKDMMFRSPIGQDFALEAFKMAAVTRASSMQLLSSVHLSMKSVLLHPFAG